VSDEAKSADPESVLVVISKVKAYIKAKSGMNTSDGIVPVLSAHVRKLLDQAIESAKTDGRKTVLDRDIKGDEEPPPIGE
jgi:hypothetical protein